MEFKREPVFEWSNPTRNGGQQGVVFLWLHDGRPAAAGCIFSSPESVVKSPGARRIPSTSVAHGSGNNRATATRLRAIPLHSGVTHRAYPRWLTPERN